MVQWTCPLVVGDDIWAAPNTPVLNHPKRVDIVHLLEMKPGLNIKQVSEMMGWSCGAVRRHLHLLIKEGHVHAHRQGNQRLHFHNSIPPMHRRAICLLHVKTLQQVVFHVMDNPRFHPAQLAKTLDLSTRSIRRAFQRLTGAGLID